MTTTANENYLGGLVREAEWKTNHAREELIAACRFFAKRLSAVADGLETNREYNINTLGVLQFDGLSIDRLCGELGVRRETEKLVKDLVSAQGD